MKKKFILISTDGDSIQTQEFHTLVAAQECMHTEWSQALPKNGLDETEAEMSHLGDKDAIMYCNGESVYVWSIVQVPSASVPIDLQNAKPIVFNAENMRALMLGQKTQTRRLVKFWEDRNPSETNLPYCAPAKYQVGDILYVQEPWNEYCLHYIVSGAVKRGYYYEAFPELQQDMPKHIYRHWGEEWKDAKIMPKEASRMYLKVTDVRLERLQDITEDDILKEGISVWDPRCYTTSKMQGTYQCAGECDFVKAFAELWNNILSEDKKEYTWAANPFVWVYEFETLNI